MCKLRARTDKYLDIVRQAGDEFANGGISATTVAELAEPLYPRKVFEQMADASREVPSNGESAAEDDGFNFTKQMATLYCPDGKERVIEFVCAHQQNNHRLLDR
jgi:hypothetical protein